MTHVEQELWTRTFTKAIALLLGDDNDVAAARAAYLANSAVDHFRSAQRRAGTA